MPGRPGDLPHLGSACDPGGRLSGSGVDNKQECLSELRLDRHECRSLEFLHFLPVSGGDEAAEGGLQADRGEQIRLFRHFFAQ